MIDPADPRITTARDMITAAGPRSDVLLPAGMLVTLYYELRRVTQGLLAVIDEQAAAPSPDGSFHHEVVAPPLDQVTGTGAPATVTAPWTEEQVKNLNDFQMNSCCHPFTCGDDDCRKDDRSPLTATVNGWTHPCGYTQDWAHAGMADGSWRRPLAAMRSLSAYLPPAADCDGMFEIRDLVHAVRWFRAGDLPYVVNLDAAAPDRECECGHLMRDHGWMLANRNSNTVHPGDWVITTVSGARWAERPAEFTGKQVQAIQAGGGPR